MIRIAFGVALGILLAYFALVGWARFGQGLAVGAKIIRFALFAVCYALLAVAALAMVRAPQIGVAIAVPLGLWYLLERASRGRRERYFRSGKSASPP